MSHDLLFAAVNLAVLPFWALMILAPRWWLTVLLMTSPLAPALFAGLYAVLSVPHLGALFGALLQPDLETIAGLLGQPDITVIAWTHYLAFDLFVGRWEYLDARKKSLSPWLVGPSLALTLMIGPVGFLSYLAVRLLARPSTHLLQE